VETGPWEALAQEFLCPFRLARAKERAELQIPVSPLCGPLVGSFPHSLFPRLLAGCGGACSDRTGAGWNETECHTVCLKNLPWWAKDSDVEKLASSFGAIALSQHRSSRTPKSRHHLRFACMRQRACMRLQGSSSSFALSTSRVTANPPASCASQTAARPSCSHMHVCTQYTVLPSAGVAVPGSLRDPLSHAAVRADTCRMRAPTRRSPLATQ
jgi:hypothetical protein